MIVSSILENNKDEKRIIFSLDVIKKYTKSGIAVHLPKGYGFASNISDEALQQSGANIEPEEQILAKTDLLLMISLDQDKVSDKLKKNASIVVTDFNKNNNSVLNKLKNKEINLFALNYLPRITRAQSMDILSSQANLAGYKAVIDSTYEFNKAVPMMMTAAGTVSPAKFFVVGAGVAGLQAIATAKRLGGVVFVEGSENLETAGGYAKEASDDFKKKQEVLLKETVKKQDIIICTALIPGKKAPRIITEEMVLSMQPGSIICDLAAAQGGNSAFSEPGKIVEKQGVRIIGYTNFASRISETASNLLAKNIFNFIELVYDKENKLIKIDQEDEIIKNVLMTGAI
jgi:H+-translocating NAD(P) transhydrogenase subunit alpha